MKYVVYYRVSTKQQGKSGLGLEAQKTAVENYLRVHKAQEIPPAFTEIESGKVNERPELKKAIQRCKELKATLLIAKLDRLARRASFIMLLKEELEKAGVGFISVDMPDANTLTIGIMASMAQHERELISNRTRAGLREAKKRGVKLGSPQNLTTEARNKAHKAISKSFIENESNRRAYAVIKLLRQDKGLSWEKIANHLNDNGYKTRKGYDFKPMSAYNIYHTMQKHNL